MEVTANENPAGVTWFLKSRALPIYSKRLMLIINITSRSCQGTLPSQVRPSDYQSDLGNRCVWGPYEMEGVRASCIFIMTSPVYWLWYGGHTQVRLSGLQELGREEGGSQLIAHIRDIKESAGSRQLDRWRCVKVNLGSFGGQNGNK